MGTRRKQIHHKVSVRPDQIKAVNEGLSRRIQDGGDLLDLNWAVYDVASNLVPSRRTSDAASEAKIEHRVHQLQEKISMARRHASRIQCVVDYITNGKAFTPKVRHICATLRRQHHTLNKAVLLTIKQHCCDRVRALVEIRKSLEKRLRRWRDNALFRRSPSRLFQEKSQPPDRAPSIQEVETYWRELYGQVPSFKQDTPALALFSALCERLQQRQGECPPVSEEEVRKATLGMKNFSAPGPDGINSFWWKKFSSTHRHLARIFNSFLNEEVPIPNWLVEGRTVLIPKKGDLSNPKNYRPITCLNVCYKIFTKILNERIIEAGDPVWREIYEQRGCKRGMAGCKENLLIDRSVTQDSVQYKRNLSMAWIDYRKAFDTTSHELVVRLLECIAVHPRIVRCIEHLLPLWRTRFTVTVGGATRSTELVQYRRGVFQGDSLSPLLFCISLMPLSLALRQTRGYKCGPVNNRRHKVTHLFYVDDLKLYASGESDLNLALAVVSTYSRDIGMAFGLDKCAVYHLVRGRSGRLAEDAQLVDGSVIKHLDAGESYQYLGVPQCPLQDAAAAKATLRGGYRQRLRQIWSSELSGRNKIAATNMLAVPILLYSFGVIRWRRDELRELDTSTRKTMNLFRSLHPRSSVPRIYLPRHLGGRGLLGLECLHDRLVLGVACDVMRSSDPLLSFVHEHERAGKGAFLYRAAEKAAEALGLEFRVGRGGRRSIDSIADLELSRRKSTIRSAEHNTLLERHVGRPMHGVFFRHIDSMGLSPRLTFGFLQSAGLMSETEGFIIACQDGVINTLVYRSRVMGMQVPDTRCRACKRSPETLMHILSACPTYAVSGYIHRHNAALRVLYYHLRHSYGVDETPLLPYAPVDIESVVGNEKCRIYWNYSFPTVRRITANKPDIVIFDHESKMIYVIEFSAPGETNIAAKEDDKRTKYQDLLFELRGLHRGFTVKLVVLIIGVLGGMKPSFVTNLNIIPACRQKSNLLAGRMQKAVILGSLRLLRSHDSGLT